MYPTCLFVQVVKYLVKGGKLDVFPGEVEGVERRKSETIRVCHLSRRACLVRWETSWTAFIADGANKGYLCVYDCLCSIETVLVPFREIHHKHDRDRAENKDCALPLSLCQASHDVYQMKGAAPDLSAATYQIFDESHTMGNALRWMIMKKCAYNARSKCLS